MEETYGNTCCQICFVFENKDREAKANLKRIHKNWDDFNYRTKIGATPLVELEEL